MKKISVRKIKLPISDYVVCMVCKKSWSIFHQIKLGNHEWWLCPECLEKLKEKINDPQNN